MNGPDGGETKAHDGRRRAARDESGQVLVITALAMTLLITMVGLVVDVGHAMLVQRQLQAGVDAAALAGAQHLPVSSEVIQVANEYSPTPGSKNAVNTVNNAVTTVSLRCVKSAPGCSTRFGTVNALTVSAQSKVPTFFGKIVGITELTVNAQATACSPCTTKPLDIMIVLDRTGSMCQFSNGQSDPACTDLNNAKEGIRTFLGFMDPALDQVGFAVFPPARDRSNLCATPTSGGARYGYDSWWPEWIPDTRIPPATPAIYAIGSLVSDYLIQDAQGGWNLNPASSLVQRIGCVQGAGTTSYSNAIEEAQHELERNGRGNVDDVIIFLSDGAANTTPKYLPAYADNSYDRLHPCAAGLAAATNAKARGSIVYTIGYDLNGAGTDPETCKLYPGGAVDTTMTAWDAIRAMATTPNNFYNKPDPGQLNSIFTRIAADLSKPAARLIDDNSP
ncbi:MAG: TadE/TadG family type IV pilus assembly protein [Actinomycetota bacterium]